MQTRSRSSRQVNSSDFTPPPLEELHKQNTFWLSPLNAKDLAELKKQVENATVIKVVHLEGGRTVRFLGRADIPIIASWSKTICEAYNQTNITLNLVDAEPLGPDTDSPLGLMSGQRPYMEDQKWHIDDFLHDHVFIGVALTDVKENSGPMEFENGFRAVGPAGSRWLYTQRIKHRGTVNKSHSPRTILLIGHAPLTEQIRF